MQLDRLVNFHKTLGDKTRIQIISLLRDGPLHGQAIAGKLGLTAPTISHHITKLREVGIIYERREKNTIYFYLDEKKLAFKAGAILKLGATDEKMMGDLNMDEKYAILKNFLQNDGRLKTIPSQRKKRLVVLEHIVKGLEKGKQYSEKEINEHIKKFHDDFATIRREFIMCQFMYRQDGQYELNPEEMWPV
ncbi:metalloregulator ArsR/SmtB family transcription factor [Anaerobacillus sp. CMMVII]|uniref:DUF2087 domain-containing protein n=1 Tax=Anaerobacillus sp. CMMVII TaxID=2755588 RepID=UPI0021B79FDF|nr:metalloregulator ArsR/SmtB family transcription factor [Anaerobacillus sp. CMMVII]MCT8139282.1 metalloregulator ArsR/SmtB family transcription factor [Anaerobacillus sp. CMMVII]